MQRSEMVRQGAQQLFATERAFDTALIELATLSSSLVRMRMDGNLSAVVGQNVIDGIAKSYASLSEARSAIVTVHKDLDAVKTQMGCRTVAFGTEDDKLVTPPSGRHVHVVVASENAA